MNAPRSIAEYLKQLRAALAGADPALIQDALYDAEEYLRAEVAANPGKSEADVLELIASTYGAPEEVATAYRDTEVKVRQALKTPTPRAAGSSSALARFFGVYLDPRSLHLTLLYAAHARHRHRVLHLRRHRPVALGGLCHPHHRHSLLPRLHRHRAGHRARGGTAARGDHRRAHAAASGAPGPPATWWARIGEMLEGRAHLDHARLPGADAAAGHRLLHGRGHRPGDQHRLASARR